MTTDAGPRRRVSKVVATETGRYWSALLVGLLTAAALRALGFGEGVYDRLAWTAYLYSAALVTYSATTVLAFTRDFEGSRAERHEPHGPVWRRWMHAKPGTDVAVTFSLLALLGAVGLAVLGGPDRSATLSVAIVVLVVTAWITVVVTYAADYARRQHRDGGLDVPGGGPRGFSDVLYFSAGVSTTFGGTDVTVVTSAMRRAVLTHSLLAFCFNTVIVALLISTLLG